MAKVEWAIKYRPKTIDEYIFHDDYLKDNIEKFIKEKNMNHLLLKGYRGIGKTTLAYVLKNELEIDDMDFLEINASDENSINTIRNKVKSFISTIAFSDFKIVFLDEADALSSEAQKSLKSMIEKYSSNAKFILTCNNEWSIIYELKSRCTEFKFKSLNKLDMMERLLYILKEEKVKIPSFDLIEEHIDEAYPDFRKVLVNAEASVKDGVLLSPRNQLNGDVKELMLSILKDIGNDNWKNIRNKVSENLTDAEIEECYRFLYDNLHTFELFKDEEKWKFGLVTIAEFLYKHAIVADPEINFTAFLIRLSEI